MRPPPDRRQPRAPTPGAPRNPVPVPSTAVTPSTTDPDTAGTDPTGRPAGVRPVRPAVVERPLPPLRRSSGAGPDPQERTWASGWSPVTRDCLAILRDRRASSDSLNVAVERMPEGFRTPLAEDDPVATAMLEMRPFLFRDPPDHTRLRGLVSKAFTPKVVESLREGTQRVVDELLDAAIDADQVDLLEAFAYPLPVRVICDLLGVPLEDQDRFKEWSNALARGLDPDFLLTEEVIAARGEAVLQFSQYFFELLAERKTQPG